MDNSKREKTKAKKRARRRHLRNSKNILLKNFFKKVVKNKT